MIFTTQVITIYCDKIMSNLPTSRQN